MPTVSAFDMFKIGVGPSSSHTLGPWRIVQRFIAELPDLLGNAQPTTLRFELLGSLALTGHGHATDKAITLAIAGEDPPTIDVAAIPDILDTFAAGRLVLVHDAPVVFNPARDIAFLRNERHPAHANAIRCIAKAGDHRISKTYFSLGGGFIADEAELGSTAPSRPLPPRPVRTGKDLLQHAHDARLPLWRIVYDNERTWFSEHEIAEKAAAIWATMKDCVKRGCLAEGTLPGGLDVRRRAARLLKDLVPDLHREDIERLVRTLRDAKLPFDRMARIVSCFAIAVNEENAAMGRVVTAPTNGAAGVIPAVMVYHACFAEQPMSPHDALRFLLVAGQIGALFKQNATISAAMGGCQAEIGVSSAMAAAALAELTGCSPAQSLMAAEIAMEHHLGMTCDPVGGLVQVPCIERNAMGAIKAIAAAAIASQSDPAHARVSLDQVINAMWETAQQMNDRYKETSLGGLAVQLSLSVAQPEC